jgi:hypothetical protein
MQMLVLGSLSDSIFLRRNSRILSLAWKRSKRYKYVLMMKRQVLYFESQSFEFRSYILESPYVGSLLALYICHFLVEINQMREKELIHFTLGYFSRGHMIRKRRNE